MDGRSIAQLTRRSRHSPAKGRHWLAIPVLLLALTACGSGGSGNAQAAGGTTAGSGAAAGGADGLSAYTSCLAQNGVTLPTPSAMPNGGSGQGGTGEGGTGPGGTGPGGTPPAGQSGMPAQGARPSGQPGGPGGGGPGAGGPGGTGALSTAAPAGVDAQTWAQARSACASLAPTPPVGASAAPTAAPTA